MRVRVSADVSSVTGLAASTMVDTQMQPLDLSCPAKRPLSPDLSPSSSYSDIRRLSHSGSESEEDRPQDLSRVEGGELSGPARKRFLSKFFRDPKVEFLQNVAAIRGESGKQVAQWMLAGLREQQLERARNWPETREEQSHPPPPGDLTGQRTHVFTTLTMASLQQGQGCLPPSPADSGVSDVEPSSSSQASDEDTKIHPRLNVHCPLNQIGRASCRERV